MKKQVKYTISGKREHLHNGNRNEDDDMVWSSWQHEANTMAKPERLGLVSTLYEQYTATHLTEALMNTCLKGEGKKNFKSINSFLIEWNLKVQKIKRLPILNEPAQKGENASDILFEFGENYYQKYDTFVVEETRQQFIVLSRPQRLSDNRWQVVARILDNDYDSAIVGEVKGKSTRFVTNYMPELHAEGYVKYQSNVETMRTHIATHRCDVDMSAQYAATEDMFIKIGKGDESHDKVYKLNTAEKDLLDTFMLARNNALMFGKSNVDLSGKPKISDVDGRPVISSDGLLAQIERFATKFAFSKLNVRYFEAALAALVSKSEKATGNTFCLIANTAFYNEWQRVMDKWIADRKTDGAFLYSKGSNGMVKLGATYEGYEFGGKLPDCLL